MNCVDKVLVLTTSPLQAQIDKLVEKCNQHELKFRSARVGVRVCVCVC
jgi:hypothetical protein